jgi:hypothetical protein
MKIASPHRLPEAQDHAGFGLQLTRSNHEIETSEMGSTVNMHCKNSEPRMSARGHSATSRRWRAKCVRQGPISDIALYTWPSNQRSLFAELPVGYADVP